LSGADSLLATDLRRNTIKLRPQAPPSHIISGGGNMSQWLNMTKYTPAQLTVFLVGCGLWAVVYFIYIRNHRRYGFIEMPVIAAASNIAWEGLWGFKFQTDMGPLLQWGYQLWFILDIYIFVMVVRYGVDQVHLPEFQKHYRAWIIGIMLAFGVFYYYFQVEGYDTPTGLTSGLIANLFISALYPFMLLRKADLVGVSTAVAWLKMVGTGLITLFAFMFFAPGEAWLIKSMGLAVLFLDLYYIWLLAARRRSLISVKSA
jgi:hypothetical protein